MPFDPALMADLAEELYVLHVSKAAQDPGVDALKLVIRTAKELYSHKQPDLFAGGLMIFSSIDDSVETGIDEPDRQFDSLADAAGWHELHTIRINEAGRFDAWAHGPAIADIQHLAIVYSYQPPDADLSTPSESIHYPGGSASVPNTNGYPSSFAAPTFWELEDAFDFYARRLAARSTCKFLKNVWAVDSDDRRLVLVNTPEVVFRESLTQYLRSTLRDAKSVRIREEQNASESHPVDIQVEWQMQTHLALIEVKWLGKCLNVAGTALARYAYSDARAREGMEQLIGYVDALYERLPDDDVLGYLVVFDARRWGVSDWEPAEITPINAWRYEHSEVTYDGLLDGRTDIRASPRIFLEPRVARP